MFKKTERLEPYKNLLNNFTSLSFLQLANYLFPFIVLPYLVRVLGPDKFGLVQFASAFNAYFLLICNYGFDLTGTKLISQNRNQPYKLSEIFSTILLVKLFLFFISQTVLVILIFSIERFSQEWQVYLFSSGSVLGSVLFPLWFFQGIERMKYITIIQVIVRSITTVFIFLLIQLSSDYLMLVILNSITYLLIGLSGLITAILKFKIKFSLQSQHNLFSMIKQGWNIFLSTVWINLYTTSNTFILGLFTNDTIVGYFSAADKIRIAFQGIQSTLSLSVFPIVSNLVKESYDEFLNFNRKLLKIAGSFGLIISLIMFFFASQITELILGDNFSFAANILRIISFLPFLISLSNVTGIQTMIPLGYDKSFNKIIAVAALVHIILLLIVVPGYSAYGVSYTVILTEIIVTLSIFIFLKNIKINLFKK